LLTLCGIFAAVFAALAISPHDRQTWLLENALVLLACAAAFLLRGHFTPSRRAAVLLLAFMCLHEVGAHYSYSKVPYDRWFEALTGHGLNELLGLHRNHFDRLVHFAAGLLLTRLLRELLHTFSNLGELGARIGALAAVMSASMVYELIEWGAAALFGGGLGAAYLGTQGDAWDAHKDMALATLGSLLALFDRGLFQRESRPSSARSVPNFSHSR
jgi:putative membrane protein